MPKSTAKKAPASSKAADDPADGVKAFEIADSMEHDVRNIERLADAILVMQREADDCQDSDALIGVAYGIKHIVERLEAKRSEIWHLTRSYRGKAALPAAAKMEAV
jgi:hypothetical protein